MSEVQINKKFKVFNSQNNRTEDIESTAATWGELKKTIGQHENMEIFIKDAVSGERTVLKFDETPLPNAGYIVLIPKKVKSGQGHNK